MAFLQIFYLNIICFLTILDIYMVNIEKTINSHHEFIAFLLKYFKISKISNMMTLFTDN